MIYHKKQKAQAVKSWLKNLEKANPKSMSKFCADKTYSTRSLRRWVSELEPAEKKAVKNEPTVEIYGTQSKVTLYRGSESLVVSKDSSPDVYAKVIGLYLQELYQEAWKAADIKTKINTVTHGRVTFNDGRVSVDGWDVKGSFIKHMIKAANDSDETKLISWCKFVDKLINLSDQSVVEEIADFMSVNSIDIDEDGDIIGYRGVKDDYWDKWTGSTFLCEVGKTISMPRHLCDSNRDEHCSTGIHFGSYDYACNWGERVMKVKVSPANVTSIPSDCNFHKARCCEMLIVDEVAA